MESPSKVLHSPYVHIQWTNRTTPVLLHFSNR